jgi:hypothetical protein
MLLDVVVPDGVVGWPDSCRTEPIIASTGRITKVR